MNYVRFLYQGKGCYGILEGQEIELLDRSYLEAECQSTGKIIALQDVKLLAPVEPGKIVCVGLNYSKHIEELGFSVHADPVLFLKPPSSVIGPEDAIVLTPMSKRVEYEAELVVVVGQTMKDVPEEEVLDKIFGYTCGNDVTARDLQSIDGQWTRSKGFDTFCPLGPWIVTDLESTDLNIRSLLNGEVKQSSNTVYLLHSVKQLISYISRVMTLNPGDVVMTGTPEGVGPMKSGDEIVVDIEGIGQLRNHVKDSAR